MLRGNTTMDAFLQFLSDPNIAYLLLTLGTLGLLVELLAPGVTIPGVGGAIALILGVVGLGQLPFSWAGLILLMLASGLFAFELHTSTGGFVSVGAVIAFVLGSIFLYQAPEGAAAVAVSPWLIGLMAGLMSAFFLLVVGSVRRSRRIPITMGQEALRQRQALVVTRLNPRGKVRLDGEIWTAELDIPGVITEALTDGAETVEAGQSVEVTGVEGVVLKVRPLPIEIQAESWESSGWN